MELSYAKAVSLALKEAMEADESVFCLGEDVGFGGDSVLRSVAHSLLMRWHQSSSRACA